MADDITAGEAARFALTTADGVDLRAELATPTGPVRATAVVCHPHPLHGGNMYANVVEALFRALPGAGVATLRFNFRGTSGSDGRHDNGRAERLDVEAAVTRLAADHGDVPLVLAGYSFGADIALAVDHEAVAAWLAVAPPLRIVPRDEQVALDDGRRGGHLVVAAHDQFRPPGEVDEIIEPLPRWTAETVQGADHFFAIGLGQVADAAVRLVDDLTTD
ncbi:MAG: alpha/beta family hydrolase [Actinomycetota bacterium]